MCSYPQDSTVSIAKFPFSWKPQSHDRMTHSGFISKQPISSVKCNSSYSFCSIGFGVVSFNRELNNEEITRPVFWIFVPQPRHDFYSELFVLVVLIPSCCFSNISTREQKFKNRPSESLPFSILYRMRPSRLKIERKLRSYLHFWWHLFFFQKFDWLKL